MGGPVVRRIAARAALVLTIASSLLAGSCWNNLTPVLQLWTHVDMVEVTGGTRQLGDVNYEYYSWEQPPHWVTLSTFLISRYEVTQYLFEQMMGYNPSYFTPNEGYVDDPIRPVERVTWLEAVEFCNKLSEAAGLQSCYLIDTTPGSESVTCDFSANGYRLPTEAEWEYAARGGVDSAGTVFAGSNTVADVAWYVDNADGMTHPVGSLQANELGLYDMSGNVWEYVWDGYTGDYQFFWDPLWAAYYSGGEPFVNPHGPFVFNNDLVLLDATSQFTSRGGSFYEQGSWAGDCERVTARGTYTNDPASPYWSWETGFRVARTK